MNYGSRINHEWKWVYQELERKGKGKVNYISLCSALELSHFHSQPSKWTELPGEYSG